MLQSSLSGQVACVGMLVCVAKQNRCRKICLKWGEGGGREGRLHWGQGGAGLNGVYPQNRGSNTGLKSHCFTTLKNHPRFLRAFPGLSKASFLFPTLHSEWGLNGSVQQEELSHWLSDFKFYFNVLLFLLINRLTLNGMESARDDADRVRRIPLILIVQLIQGPLG